MALLAEATKQYAVTIVAGAGYGKYTAVSSFLSRKKLHTTWISLTQLDNLDKRLWDLLCNAIYSASKNTNEITLPLDFPNSDYELDNLIKTLNGLLDSRNKHYLVLDDFQNITNNIVLTFIEKLIIAQMQNLCVIIIS